MLRSVLNMSAKVKNKTISKAMPIAVIKAVLIFMV